MSSQVIAEVAAAARILAEYCRFRATLGMVWTISF